MVTDSDWHQLFTADQTDRTAGLSDSELSQRDAQRIVWVSDNAPITPYAHYVGALIYHHHGTRAEMDLAYDWAISIIADVVEAKPLAAMIDDRRCLMDGRPQRYGTQYRRTDGRWHLAPYDPQTTDTERADMNIRPLTELLAEADRLNGHS